MQNLLRTLTESQYKTAQRDTDLKLLLSAVKESRRQSHDTTKLADAFYDSLEGLLHDLRTVTMDNRDAEAFLKPVSKTDVPDYYDVIANPMDLQTMLKKVKQKQYKSKKDFKDDLDLIWSNCFTYNATENHPLRVCAKRLKAKAEKLLKHITDWKERADPSIPVDISVRGVTPKLNGVTLNGHARPLSPTVIKSPSPGKVIPTHINNKKVRRDVPFLESPAIIRTPSGMAAFLQLDQELDSRPSSNTSLGQEFRGLEERLNELIAVADDENESINSDSPDISLKTVEGEVGAKRKLNGYNDLRPRKRARTQQSAERDVVELWWDALQSDDLLGNGLPTLVYQSSEDVPSLSPAKAIVDPPRERKTHRHKKTEPPKSSLLSHLNNNIRTMRRVRSTHAKFAALSQNIEEVIGPPAPSDLPPEDVEDILDERPWKPMGSGIDIGEENADDCLHWMGSKILEHAGFQGTSKVALDVLAGVTSEYLLNVGRTIRFLCDKYAKKMTPEEIILHTLFESGTTKIYELERYIKDDIVRYGSRLAELEKKLANAYREATTEEAWDDDALFQIADDEEEEGEFVMGNFADSFGEDFLGLRELGIAAEFGLSSLTIPKKLLKGKGKGNLKEGQSTAKPTEPPPPFPPPPPFVPLDSKTVDDQIGLLKPYYQQRLASVSSSIIPSSTNLNSSPSHVPNLPPTPGASYTQAAVTAAFEPNSPPLILPDDAPTPSHTKIGPLGQIMKGAPSATAAKKKSKGKAPMESINGPSEAEPFPKTAATSPPAVVDSQKKGKNANGPMGKRKAKGPEAFPAAVVASA
ncbi:hypothetical protein AcW1_003374 [Taiwanofungus camphoratus]|nr:hypothetical protein AcW1_003374 [Antrodia cinnamomea]